MRTPKPPAPSKADGAGQVRSFIAKFEPRHQTIIRTIRRALRRRMPWANELVYDNYNFFVIGYSPTARPSDAILSIAAGASGASICFIQGVRLADPEGLLSGGGRQTRFIRVERSETLTRPGVMKLIDAAVVEGKPPLRSSRRGQLIVRSVSAKQRPRRRAPR